MYKYPIICFSFNSFLKLFVSITICPNKSYFPTLTVKKPIATDYPEFSWFMADDWFVEQFTRESLFYVQTSKWFSWSSPQNKMNDSWWFSGSLKQWVKRTDSLKWVRLQHYWQIVNKYVANDLPEIGKISQLNNLQANHCFESNLKLNWFNMLKQFTNQNNDSWMNLIDDWFDLIWPDSLTECMNTQNDKI